MKNLLEINLLDKSLIENILLQSGTYVENQPQANKQHINLANLFYENSTRTRVSFELAADQIGLNVINIDLATSSEQKGETVLDTVKTLHSMGIKLFVMRHQQERLVHEMSRHIKTASFINAGDGMHAHPTQALIDLLTIQQCKGVFEPLRVVILGDIKHSRVANSLLSGLSIMGTRDIVLLTDTAFLPDKVKVGKVEQNISDALKGADVIVTLRVQKERINALGEKSVAQYKADYCLNEERLALAKSDAIVMHPGPMNRGIELSDAVADGPQSVILNQVSNGVPVRMAVLEYALT